VAAMIGGPTESYRRGLMMPTGLYVTADGRVVVNYGTRKLSIPISQYKANGYKPSFEKLLARATTSPRSIPRPLRQSTDAGVPNG
jgi:hypothetical protein